MRYVQLLLIFSAYAALSRCVSGQNAPRSNVILAGASAVASLGTNISVVARCVHAGWHASQPCSTLSCTIYVDGTLFGAITRCIGRSRSHKQGTQNGCMLRQAGRLAQEHRTLSAVLSTCIKEAPLRAGHMASPVMRCWSCWPATQTSWWT